MCVCCFPLPSGTSFGSGPAARNSTDEVCHRPQPPTKHPAAARTRGMLIDTCDQRSPRGRGRRGGEQGQPSPSTMSHGLALRSEAPGAVCSSEPFSAALLTLGCIKLILLWAISQSVNGFLACVLSRGQCGGGGGGKVLTLIEEAPWMAGQEEYNGTDSSPTSSTPCNSVPPSALWGAIQITTGFN